MTKLKLQRFWNKHFVKFENPTAKQQFVVKRPVKTWLPWKRQIT